MKSFLTPLLTASAIGAGAAVAQTSAVIYNDSPTTTISSPFQLYTLTAEDITAVVVPYGARLTSLLVPDREGRVQDVALGYDTGEEYLQDTLTEHTYFGAVVGRYANRIKNGTFTIDGQTFRIPNNEHDGLNSLHGGYIGYDQRNWTVTSVNTSSISLQLFDDNFQGFPGKVLTTATFSVSSVRSGPQGQLRPRLTTKLVSVALDHATPIMLSNHIYWNLNAFKAQNMLNDTTFWMPYSKRYIEIDDILIPTGQIGVVSAAPALDFIAPKLLGTAVDAAQGVCGFNCTGIDNAFIIDRPQYSGQDDAAFPILSLWSSITGIQMDVSTNQQGVQIYSCNGQDGVTPVKPSQVKRNSGIRGSAQHVEQYGCAAIEPQAYVDGINHPEWGIDKFEIFTPETGPAVNFATYDFSTFP